MGVIWGAESTGDLSFGVLGDPGILPNKAFWLMNETLIDFFRPIFTSVEFIPSNTI